MPKRPEIKALNLLLGRGDRADSRHPVDTFTDDGDAGRVVNIPVSAIRPNPDQPRTYFDPEALHDLTESVRERGILQPIIVRRATDGKGFFLIAGERRWRAATAAGLTKIPALTRQKEDPAEIALIENLQREDLNPIEEAESLKRLAFKRQIANRVPEKNRLCAAVAHQIDRGAQPSWIAVSIGDINPNGPGNNQVTAQAPQNGQQPRTSRGNRELSTPKTRFPRPAAPRGASLGPQRCFGGAG